MKISVTMYENTVVYESPNDDLDSTEALDIYIALLRAMGYHENSINRSLKKLYNENLCNE